MIPKPLLLGTLAATLAATGWLAAQPEPGLEVVVPAQPLRTTATATAPSAAPLTTVVSMLTPPPAPLAAATPAAPRGPWPAAPAAAVAAWGAPAAPPAVVVAPTAPPQPPPPAFPYQWIGQVLDGNDRQALLSGPQRSLGVRVGDVVDGRWRVDAIADGRVETSYLTPGDTAVPEPR